MFHHPQGFASKTLLTTILARPFDDQAGCWKRVLHTLLDQPDPAWLWTAPSMRKTPLHALAGHFQELSWPATRATEAAEQAARRDLLVRLWQAVPEDIRQEHVSRHASERAREASKEAGAGLLAAAYHLEAWDVAADLEALGHDAIGLPYHGVSVLMNASWTAWERAKAQGWDPLSTEEMGQGHARGLRRWQWAIGPRFPRAHEGNCLVRQRVLAWAREHDPKGWAQWHADGVGRLLCQSSTMTSDEVDNVWQQWQTLPPDVHTSSSGTLWIIALQHAPDVWWPRLREQWEQLKTLLTRPLTENWMMSLGPQLSAMPPESCAEMVRAMETLVAARPQPLLQTVSFMQNWARLGLPQAAVQAVATERWWQAPGGSTLPGCMGLMLDTDGTPLALDALVAVASVHPVPLVWQCGVALAAARQYRGDLIERLIDEGLTADTWQAWQHDWLTYAQSQDTEALAFVQQRLDDRLLRETLTAHLPSGQRRARPRL